MTTATHTQGFVSSDLEKIGLPEGWRAEVVDGELFVSKQPSWEHQAVVSRVVSALLAWSEHSGLGDANSAPGVVYGDRDDVAPDVVWASNERIAASMRDGRFYGQGPELMVEVLSPGPTNERRDRVAKLELYRRRGVREYWLCDPIRRTIDVYRRAQPAERLEHTATLVGDDQLESPLLPGFSVPVRSLFARVAPRD